jgi:hypothetical protein
VVLRGPEVGTGADGLLVSFGAVLRVLDCCGFLPEILPPAPPRPPRPPRLSLVSRFLPSVEDVREGASAAGRLGRAGAGLAVLGVAFLLPVREFGLGPGATGPWATAEPVGVAVLGGFRFRPAPPEGLLSGFFGAV